MAMCAIVSCDGHMPCGVLVEKDFTPRHITSYYSPVLHRPMPRSVPARWVFRVQCDSCGHVHSCRVDEPTFNRFNVGDSVNAKGVYYGKEKR